MRLVSRWAHTFIVGKIIRAAPVIPCSAKYSTTSTVRKEIEQHAGRDARKDGIEGDNEKVSPQFQMTGDTERSIENPSTQARARSLLRSILRECSYLPDPQARQYISHHVLSRFQKTSFEFEKRRRDARWSAEEQRNYITKEVKSARKALNKLTRANDGERKPLLRLLLIVYGRVGRRKRELMQPLMPTAGREQIDQILRGQEDGEDEEDEHTSDPKDSGQRKVTNAKDAEMGKAQSPYLPQLSPELHALVTSQIKASPPTLVRANPRRTKPDIPAVNSKLKPMPQSRVKNMTKKWFATTLHRTLPPLPTEEWYRLLDLARGKTAPMPLTPLRSSGSHLKPRVTQTEHSSALEMIVSRGKRKIDPMVFRRRRRERITSRFMMRLYAQLFEICPLMEWDTVSGRWKITWGHHALHGDHRAASTSGEDSKISIPGAKQQEAIDGKDER